MRVQQGREAMIVRLVALVTVAAAVVLLWLMPGALFPHPSINEAIELSAVGPLVYVATLGAAGVSLVGLRLLGWRAEGPVGVGVFLLGLAAAFVGADVAFGNFSDDRFLPLLLTPVLAVPVGAAIVVSSLAMKSTRGRPLVGAVRGAAAAGAIAVWLAARGAADWLQAPYGFDVYALIAIAGATVLYLGVDAGSSASASA
jgi:hypothetical protein